MKLAGLIDAFAEALGHRGVRVDPNSETPWLAGFMAQMPERLPRSYEYLLTHYRFAVFRLSEVDFYSNLGDDGPSDLVAAAMADRALWSACVSSSLVPVGRPADGSYDPICFDLRRPGRDAPLVRLDHEDVLSRERITIAREVSPSFLQLVEDVVAGRRAPDRVE
jgi:hypothetical protein